MSKIILNNCELKQLIHNVLREMNEDNVTEALTYDELKNGSKLESLRSAIDNNKTVSVVFVKKDGSVRPMAFRKNFNYDFKKKDTLDLQNVNATNNLLRGYDINVYIKIKRETGDAKEAATRSWRAIKLENVLGFLVGGKFIDLREENKIMDRFGESIYNQLTKSMVTAANSELNNAGAAIVSIKDENTFTNECSIKEEPVLEKVKNKSKIDKVMGEFSKGKLKTSYGTKVTDPKQAVAIAYSEAGISKNESIKESLRKEVSNILGESTAKMRNRIYKVIDRTGVTKKIYRDEYWAGVSELVKIIKSIEGVNDAWLSVENGGYRTSKDGLSNWKEYKLEVDTIEGAVNGIVNAHAAGTVEDPFKSYDLTMTLW